MAWENLAADILEEFASVQLAPESLLAGWSAFVAERERQRSEDRRAAIYAVPALYAKWLGDTRRWAQGAYRRLRADPERWQRHLEKARAAYERRKKDPTWLERKRERGRAARRAAWKRKRNDPAWLERSRARKRAAYAAKKRLKGKAA